MIALLLDIVEVDVTTKCRFFSRITEKESSIPSGTVNSYTGTFHNGNNGRFLLVSRDFDRKLKPFSLIFFSKRPLGPSVSLKIFWDHSLQLLYFGLLHLQFELRTTA